MRLLGIDYGTKRIGVAVSDEAVAFAFPHSVIVNDKNAIKKIAEICGEKNVGKIILGESVDYSGQPNLIMKKVEGFKAVLEKETGLPVIYQRETLTTLEAGRPPADKSSRSPANLKKSRRGDLIEKNDASAAALILRSFLESGKMI